jgi:hypothetical protein
MTKNMLEKEIILKLRNYRIDLLSHLDQLNLQSFAIEDELEMIIEIKAEIKVYEKIIKQFTQEFRGIL